MFHPWIRRLAWTLAVLSSPLSHAALFQEDAGSLPSGLQYLTNFEQRGSSGNTPSPGAPAFAASGLEWSLDAGTSGTSGGERTPGLPQWRSPLILGASGGALLASGMSPTTIDPPASPVPLTATLWLFASALAAIAPLWRRRVETPSVAQLSAASASSLNSSSDSSFDQPFDYYQTGGGLA